MQNLLAHVLRQSTVSFPQSAGPDLTRRAPGIRRPAGDHDPSMVDGLLLTLR